ncbi:MAG: c-type cytochrome [Chloroflexota bacterium]|nr:c-type cytochrome [Chloroflexota bacterium]MBI5703322.1 c-type cytochrome [Chloroflexota bacterium]
MKRTSKWLVLTGVLLIAAALLAACGGQKAEPTTAPATEPPATAASATEPPAPELTGDPIRGGKLYDNWMKTLGVDAPEGDQPLWKTQTTNTRSGKDTWRCKECHGWDYKGVEGAYGKGSHMTGFVGVAQVAGKDPNEILAALKTGDHDFSPYMDDQALTDLALFLSGYQFDASAFIDADKKAVGGDVANGQAIYEENCIDCHGPEGLSMNFADDSGPEYYGTIAIDNPLEFIHKARFGQPGFDKMPSLVDVGLSDSEYADLLAYAQTFPTSSPVTEGAHLYDNWIKAIGADDMTENQPLWATQTTNTRTGNDTWRCKECHGWDYLGKDGRYASGSHATGFPGIFAAKDKSAEELIAALKGENHDFSQYLGDAQLNALVAFIQQLQDMKPYINDDKTVNGDAEHGKTLFTSVCANCHGEDGTAIDFDDGEGVEYVGTVAADNPWEAFNKFAYGQPAAPMPAGINLGWSWQDIVDLLAYAQTLPTK